MKTLIVYGSKRGKTRELAEMLNDYFRKNGINSEVKNAWETTVVMVTEADILIFASSTWADGDLQADFIELERNLFDTDLSGKYAAVFGPGNSRFPRFCEAVEILQARLKNNNAKLLINSLKIDRLADTDNETLMEWAEELLPEILDIIENK